MFLLHHTGGRAARHRARASSPPGGRGPRRRSRATLLLMGSLTLAAAVATSITTAAPASAHATLVKATPADGSVLTSAPPAVTLQFDEPVSTSFATLAVTGPDGRDVATGRATVRGSTVTVGLSTDLASGTYRTVFRVVSDDGHPVNGQLGFSLRLPGASASGTPGTPSGSATAGGAAGPSPTATTAPSPHAQGSSGAADTSGQGASRAGGESWFAGNLLPLSGVLALLVIGAGALLWDRMRA
jgi:copper resistance protein C